MSPIREPLQPGGGTVEIRIAPSRTLNARNPDGSQTSLEAVNRVRAEPIGVRGDSVTFRIDSWWGGNPVEEHKKTQAETVLSASDPDVSFFRDRISLKKNLLAVAIVVGLVALSIGQASVGY